MSTLEEIRRKKLEELMRLQSAKSHEQADEKAQLQQQVAAMENAVKRFFTKEALVRFGNLKTAHQEKALQLIVVLFQAIQKGQVQGQIDDVLLRKILEQLSPKKREIKINRI